MSSHVDSVSILICHHKIKAHSNHLYLDNRSLHLNPFLLVGASTLRRTILKFRGVWYVFIQYHFLQRLLLRQIVQSLLRWHYEEQLSGLGVGI